MAAYAALTSLMQILDQLQRHPFPPISLDGEQVESLTEIVTSLQEFLEGYNSPFADNIPDDKDASSGPAGEAINISGEEISCVNFYQDLWKVIEEMDLLKKELMEMKREKTDVQAHHLLQRNTLRSSSFTGKNSGVMVGFDDVLLQLLHKLTGEPSSDLQVIPITGMGGIERVSFICEYMVDG